MQRLDYAAYTHTFLSLSAKQTSCVIAVGLSELFLVEFNELNDLMLALFSLPVFILSDIFVHGIFLRSVLKISCHTF